MGIASFVLSLAAWPAFFAGIFPGVICAILAIVFGAIVFPKGKANRGLGIAGFAIGIFFFVFYLGGIALSSAFGV